MIDSNFSKLEPFLITVFLEDTDATGMVYHARYLNFLERARTSQFYHIGIDHAQMISEGLGFVVKRAAVDFIKPAGLQDRLCVESIILNSGPASITLGQEIHRDKKIITQAKIDLACIHLSGRVCRIPEQIIKKLKFSNS